VNVKEELKVFRLENTNIRARIDSQCNKPSSAGAKFFHVGVADSMTASIS
jgi:hypothetical protein